VEQLLQPPPAAERSAAGVSIDDLTAGERTEQKTEAARLSAAHLDQFGATVKPGTMRPGAANGADLG
jgi:hypothetical protein